MKKRCKKCDLLKNSTEFYKDKNKSDGLNHLCKDCDTLYKRNYYKKNIVFKIKKVKHAKEYYKKNKVRIGIRMKEYNKRNRLKNNAYGKEHYKKNKEKINERCRIYHQNNKEREKENHRIWKLNHKDLVTEQNYRRRIDKLGAEGSHIKKEWERKKKEYNYRCAYCGIHENVLKNEYKCKKWWKLTKDHITPLTKNGTDYIDNIVPACISCNTIKHNRINYVQPQQFKLRKYSKPL